MDTKSPFLSGCVRWCLGGALLGAKPNAQLGLRPMRVCCRQAVGPLSMDALFLCHSPAGMPTNTHDNHCIVPSASTLI